jgi:hypothetical protein
MLLRGRLGGRLGGKGRGGLQVKPREVYMEQRTCDGVGEWKIMLLLLLLLLLMLPLLLIEAHHMRRNKAAVAKTCV